MARTPRFSRPDVRWSDQAVVAPEAQSGTQRPEGAERRTFEEEAWRRRMYGRRALVVGAACSLLHRPLRAESPNVPIRLQAELLAKVTGYDRNFEARSGEQARVLIMIAPGDSDSKLSATDMKSALAAVPSVGGLSHDEEIASYVDAPTLGEMCRAKHIAIVYLTPGFSGEIPAIRDAVGSLKLLTVASLADYVPAGIVLGFDLVSGRPKLVVNLSQARRQHVDFRAEVLKLMRVYE